MNEVITGIRVIKMYGWENAFHRFVSGIRKQVCFKIKKFLLTTLGHVLKTIVFSILAL